MLQKVLLMLVSMYRFAKPKLLCILHRSPPDHGAAKVGDFIASSNKLKENFECRFITIKSSKTINDIGKVNLKKVYYSIELYSIILWALLWFKPQKIYFTVSIRSVAFYRDLLISILLKVYKKFRSTTEVYYHYHTKGVDEFVSSSERNLKLTRFFIKDVNLILLSPVLEKDFKRVQTFKQVFYLPNGVEDLAEHEKFDGMIESKYGQTQFLEVLFLSNMIKSKGYFKVLELANKTKDQSIYYNFAGNWQNSDDKKEFFNYIEQNNLTEKVTFHGFVNGVEKQNIFKKAHLFILPTRYDAFPLSILEALSFGVPVIATNEGSIPYILNKKTGIVLDDDKKLNEAFEVAKKKLLNKETARHCRAHFLKNFTLETFEENLIHILKDGQNV
jgi:glycosyltransferase involved in cell wall biosynthesis